MSRILIFIFVALTISESVIAEGLATKSEPDATNREQIGFFLGYSPSYRTEMSRQLGSDVDMSMDLGMNYGAWQLSYKRTWGTVGEFQAPTKNTPSAGVNYSTLTQGKQVTEQLFAGRLISLIDPYTTWDNAQLGIPILAGLYQQTLKASGRTFGNAGYDLASGVAVKWFTRAGMTFDVATLYHLAAPLWGVRETADSQAIRSSGGENIGGRTSGFELRLGFGFVY